MSSLDALKALLGGLLAKTAGTGRVPLPTRERLAQPLLDAIDIAVYVSDADGTLFYLNAAWARLTGSSLEEGLGSPLLAQLHPGDHELLLNFLDGRLRQLRDPESVTLRLLTKAGECVRVELRAEVIGADDGTASIVIGTLTDVSRRVHAEELKQASHRTLETLINNLPGMVYRGRNNPQWTMEFVSEGCRALTGWPPDAFINNRLIAFAELIDPEDRPHVWDDVQTALRENRHFELAYRIRTAQGAEKWVLERGQGNIAASGELLGLEGFITDITAEKRAELRLQHDSMHDAATDLPVRPLFMDRLDMALRRAHASDDARFALMLVYLDRFAKIRARYGPDFNDRVALDLSRRFQRLLEPVDSMCRWHDDEFAILIEFADTHRDVTLIARQLQETLQTPVIDRDTKIFLTASIGIALSDDSHRRGEELFQDAAAAMTRAKELGGARHELSVRRAGYAATARSQLEVELQAAIDGGQLCLCYEPVATTAASTVIGLEVRPVWLHPRHGRLSADKVFTPAEDTHLIKPVKGWYLNALQKQISVWREQLALERTPRLHLEIPSRALLEPGYLNRLTAALCAAAAGTFRLAFEIRAEMLGGDSPAARELLELLRERGIDLIVDVIDSSVVPLGMLQAIHGCVLRIGEDCVSDGEGGLTRGILALARQMRLPVVARGVTSQAQLEALTAAGCHYYQGSLLEPPGDAASAAHWLGLAGSSTAVARPQSDPAPLH